MDIDKTKADMSPEEILALHDISKTDLAMAVAMKTSATFEKAKNLVFKDREFLDEAVRSEEVIFTARRILEKHKRMTDCQIARIAEIIAYSQTKEEAVKKLRLRITNFSEVRSIFEKMVIDGEWEDHGSLL